MTPDTLSLVERLEAGEVGNKLDVLIDVALFKPGPTYTAARPTPQRTPPMTVARKIVPVFDRGRHDPKSNNPEIAAGLTPSGLYYQAHRTDRDRAPPRSTVTAILMGDPKPGRSALAMSKAST
jgi:hypothetical protein